MDEQRSVEMWTSFSSHTEYNRIKVLIQNDYWANNANDHLVHNLSLFYFSKFKFINLKRMF